ncbi:cms1 ribosomal small subunit [Coemansia sp. RSA 1878]|nr:cms1 ribosomal small subunit [Coemansia sp. RSA 1878]
MARNTDDSDDLQNDFDLDNSFSESSEPEQQFEPAANAKPEPEAKSKSEPKAKSKSEPKPETQKRKQPSAVSAPTKKPKLGTKKFTVPASLADQCTLWNKYMHKTYPALTQLELTDIQLTPSHMYVPSTEPSRDSTSYVHDLVQTAMSTGKGKNKVMHGAPQALIICSSALRVVELVKMLRVVTKRPVAKLFSRHIKIDTQKKMLEEGAVDVAVGTPNRVLRLLRDGDLKVNRLKLVAIDCWQDEKMRVVVDIDDTRSDLFAIWRDVLLPASKNPDYNFKLRLM